MVFLNVHVKNFKSLVDFQLDLMEKKDFPKELAIIYGENGSGKTNIVHIFSTLIETLQTMKIKYFLEDLLSKEEDVLSPLSSDQLFETLRSQAASLSVGKIIRGSKTIGSEENLALAFEFRLDDRLGSYTLEFDDEKIVFEKLEYLVDKRKATFFEIGTNSQFLNAKMFANEEYATEIKNKIEKFWGKHTLMSILVFEILEKNIEYVENNLNKNLIKVVDTLANIQCYAASSERLVTTTNKTLPLNGNFLEGTVNSKDMLQLEDSAEILTTVFSNLYSDVKQLYYKTKNLGSKNLAYELYLKKMIGGKIRDIPFKLESKGTTNILNLLPALFSAIHGNTVILDEFDTGIHDILIRDLFAEVSSIITGQLIMTSHNTLLLESSEMIENKHVYVINIDEFGNKEINALDKYDLRVHKNHNRRSQYLKGLYQGTPLVGNLDFESVAKQLRKTEGR